MKTKMKIVLLSILIIPQLICAQKSQLWTNPDTDSKPVTRQWDGLKANRKDLNYNVLDAIIRKVKQDGAATISIPHPDGGAMFFNIRPGNLLSKEVQAKNPEIQTFKGYSDKGELIRIDVSPDGFNAIVFSNEGTIYLDPVTSGNKQHLSYFSNDYENPNQEQFNPHSNGSDIEEHHEQAQRFKNTTADFTPGTMGDSFKKYRIAILVKSNFTEAVGKKDKNKTLGKIVTLLNRTTALYETQLAITFELVTGTEMIFTDKGPFASETNRLSGEGNDRIAAIEHLNNENIFGADKYDVGHVIAYGWGGGMSAMAQVCRDKLKAGTMSCYPKTVTIDRFAVDIFAHELGHQFGAFHSFSSNEAYHCNNGLTLSGAYEIGSGITIMSYAGLCGFSSTAGKRVDYFHARSVEEITNYVTHGAGNRCYTVVENTNIPPKVTVREGGFTIPIETPFVLDAEAKDEDNDALVYNWQQYDKATGAENLIGTKEKVGFRGDGPLFRNFMPSSGSERYFPQLTQVVSGGSSNKEVLPFTSRPLNFVINVRDQKGGISNSLVTFSSTKNAGPFVVTSKFPDASYNGFSTYKVEWDVANTDKAPVNCKKVNILFSVDGGKKFDYVILANTDNDGSENIQLPNIKTTKARIMVKAADNIFFNVNQANFTIKEVEAAIPGVPVDLTGNSAENLKVPLSWTHTGTLENGFIIERKKEGAATFKKIGETVFDETTFIDNNVEEGTTYIYRVAAFNGGGMSGYSNTAKVVVEAGIKAPDAPLSLTGTSSAVSASISWTDNSTIEEGFIIERKTDGEPDFEKIGETGPDVTTFTDDNVTKDVTYIYRVAAFNEAGTSTHSNTVVLTVADGTLSLAETKELQNFVFPSPTAGQLYLSPSLAQEAKNIMVFDLRGSKLLEIQSNGPTHKIDVSGFESGLYLMKISTSDQEIVLKFYKK